MHMRTCYVKGVMIISFDIKSMTTLKVNHVLGVSLRQSLRYRI
jgi:hypothetical protein